MLILHNKPREMLDIQCQSNNIPKYQISDKSLPVKLEPIIMLYETLFLQLLPILSVSILAVLIHNFSPIQIF